MISENEEALFILLFSKLGPSWSQNSSEMCLVHSQGCMKSFSFSNISEKKLPPRIYVLTKDSYKIKKYEKSPKKEEGGDAKYVFFFIWPKS